MFRGVFENLQAKSGYTVCVDHPIFDWMVEWSAALITRYVKGTDGRSAYGRLRGHETNRDIAEFGEKVLYTPLVGSHNVRGHGEHA